MLHNKASEGLVKTDRVGYDLYSGIADTKALSLKFCRQFERRICSLVPIHRVVPAGDGEDSTTISVLGFVVDAKVKKKTFAPQKVEVQFLENHKTLYLDLHREFTKSEYAPQSEASLQNFKTLLMLEITILLGTDIEWATGSTGCATVADPPVLAPAAAADDGDASISEDSDAPGRAIRNAAAKASAPAIANADDDTDFAGGGADAAAGGGGAGAPAAPNAAEDADRNVLDMGDFMTWQPDTWVSVDYDKIQFPTDPMRSICSVRSYFAVAMILWHDPALREKHARTSDRLTAAWKATLHHDLCSRALQNWPEDGPHGFNAADQSAWLSGTLHFLKHGPGRPTSSRRRVVPAAAAAAAAAPPPPAEPPRRDSSKAQRRQGASSKIRDPDPVR
jgi:hypothetical protein